MTLREIVFDVWNIMRSGHVNDTESISYSEVKFWVKTTLASLIRQDLNKGRTISENIISHIYGLKMEVADISDLPACLNMFTGCYIVKSVKQLPKPIELADRDLILSIQPGNFLAQNYTIIPRARLSYINYNKWTKNKPFAVLRDRWLYLINDPNVEYVTIEMVLEDAEELAGYTNCVNSTQCYDDESPYPVSAHYIDIMKQMIMKTNFSIINNPTDLSENGNPDYKQNTQKPPVG